MAFTRRVIYFDRRGRKHMVFRSMGDGEVDCSDHATWLADPVCQATNPNLFPAAPPTPVVDPNTGNAVAAPAVVPAPGGDSWFAPLYAALDKLKGGQAAPGAAAPTIAGIPQNVALIGGAAIAAYFLFGKKKRKA